MGSCHPTSPAFLHTHLLHGMRLHGWTEHTITLVSFNVVAVHSTSLTAQCIWFGRSQVVSSVCMGRTSIVRDGRSDCEVIYRDVGTMHAPGWKPQPSLEGPYLSDMGSPAEAHETPHHQATSGGRWMMLWWRIGGPIEVLLLLLAIAYSIYGYSLYTVSMGNRPLVRPVYLRSGHLSPSI